MPAGPTIRVLAVTPFGTTHLVDVELANPTHRERFFRVRVAAGTATVAPAECEVSVFPGQPGIVTFSIGSTAAPMLNVVADVDDWGRIEVSTNSPSP
jgi:hypothetical protein